MNKKLYTFGQKGSQRAANLSVSFLRSRLAASPRPLPAPEPEAPPRPREGPRSRRTPSVLFSSVRRAQCSAEDNSTRKDSIRLKASIKALSNPTFLRKEAYWTCSFALFKLSGKLQSTKTPWCQSIVMLRRVSRSDLSVKIQIWIELIFHQLYFSCLNGSAHL